MISNPPAFSPDVTLLDYFASQADQPGTTEAYQIAGEPPVDTPPGWNEATFRTDLQARAAIWWTKLPVEEKYRLYAKMRYMIAVAMLAEREAAMKETPHAE